MLFHHHRIQINKLISYLCEQTFENRNSFAWKMNVKHRLNGICEPEKNFSFTASMWATCIGLMRWMSARESTTWYTLMEICSGKLNGSFRKAFDTFWLHLISFEMYFVVSINADLLALGFHPPNETAHYMKLMQIEFVGFEKQWTI